MITAPAAFQYCRERRACIQGTWSLARHACLYLWDCQRPSQMQADASLTHPLSFARGHCMLLNNSQTGSAGRRTDHWCGLWHYSILGSTFLCQLPHWTHLDGYLLPSQNSVKQCPMTDLAAVGAPGTFNIAFLMTTCWSRSSFQQLSSRANPLQRANNLLNLVCRALLPMSSRARMSHCNLSWNHERARDKGGCATRHFQHGQQAP